MLLVATLLLSSDMAYATQGCGTLRFHRELSEAENSIVHTVKFEPPVGELPTRNGSYECVRFSFRVDRTGHPADIRIEESSNDYMLVVDAHRALSQFRFRQHEYGIEKRLMLVFDGMVGRSPDPPSQQK
jgi:hypothetical protein